MKLRTITAGEFCQQMRIGADDAGAPTPASLARLIRAAVARRRVVPQREVREYVLAQLRAGGFRADESRDRLQGVLARLLTLGDVAALKAHDAGYLAATEPGWIRVAPGVAVLVGTLDDIPDLRPVMTVGEAASDLAEDPLDALVRRFDPRDVASRAALNERAASEFTLREWCGVPAYTRYLRRRRRVASENLVNLWRAVEDAFERDSGPVSDPARVRVISGPPGSFFGKVGAPNSRWSAAMSDGLWCGAQRGYSDEHWHPAVIQVTGNRPTRALHLYDHEERCWALIARGLHTGADEIIRVQDRDEGRDVAFTFPPPPQVTMAMRLVGRARGPWSWRLPRDADPPWQLFW